MWPAGVGTTVIQPHSLLHQLAAFPRPLPTGSELGSAKERPWCDIKRQEEGQSLAHPALAQGQADAAAASGSWLRPPPQRAERHRTTAQASCLGLWGALTSWVCFSRPRAAAAFLVPDLWIAGLPLGLLQPCTQFCNHSLY